MKRILLGVIAASLVACQHELKQVSSDEADVGKELTTVPDTDVGVQQDGNASDSTSHLGAELRSAVEDTLTDRYFIEIFKRGELVAHSDDNKILSVTDSLFSKDSEKDFFYFVVFTKSMNGSDGFYSEALGKKAFEFVTTKTEQFSDYFSVTPNLSDKDMRNWASEIVGEIQIESEGGETQAIQALENQSRKNISTFRKEYLLVIERLLEHIEDIKKDRITEQ